MPNALMPLSLGVPAFKGLNTEKATSILGAEWATELNNVVFDSSGRVASRKGWSRSSTIPTGKVKALIDFTGGGIISAAGGKLYLDETDITGSLTPSGDLWKFVHYNDHVIGFQDGESPIGYNGSNNFADLVITHGGAMPTSWSGVGVAAYGRLWVMDSSKQTLKYSALLDETDFDASGTLTDITAGFIDLKSVWKNGFDEVQAIESHNGHLILFGKKSILIYDNPTLPFSSMSLVEDVTGIGCIARDSVVVVGEDVWFLSSSGVRSLGRTIVKDKMPLLDYSKNIRQYLINNTITVGTKESIKAVYNEREGFYLLSVPESGRVFVFDLRAPLDDGSVRVSTWTDNVPTALLSANNDQVYMGQTGYVGIYDTYQDRTSSYDMSYKSGWMTIPLPQGGDTATRLTMPKKLKAIVYAGYSTSVTFSWKFDFASTGHSYTRTLTGESSSEYNVAEFGVDEFGGGGSLLTIKVPMKGHGNLLKFELLTTIAGSELAIQKLDIYSKLGRLN